MLVFGPIPSRRLGQSLGVNTIPLKHCTYNCLYCQVGPTPETEIQRQSFYSPEIIEEEVRERVNSLRKEGKNVDYLSIVPDGEPTLDINLGKTIRLLKPLGIKIAVITNGSLLELEEVRNDLMPADLVSLKVDSVNEKFWRRVNIPNKRISLAENLEGAIEFSRNYEGKLITETMLLKGLNDEENSLRDTAVFIKKLKPSCAYLGIPTRPPAFSAAQAPDEKCVTSAYTIFSQHLDHVEIMTGYPKEGFDVSGDAIRNLLEITCVHPMLENEALALLDDEGLDRSVLNDLVNNGQLKMVKHLGQTFYIRKLQETA